MRIEKKAIYLLSENLKKASENHKKKLNSTAKSLENFSNEYQNQKLFSPSYSKSSFYFFRVFSWLLRFVNYTIVKATFVN